MVSDGQSLVVKLAEYFLRDILDVANPRTGSFLREEIRTGDRRSSN
jgi:hypothetical protein